MKRIRVNRYNIVTIIMMTFLLYVVFFFTLKRNDNNNLLYNTNFIGHAFYGIDNIDYTNSKEAFLEGYNNGIKIMEVDFLFTSDKELVLNHFWENSIQDSSTSFLSKKVVGKYTPMNLDDLLLLMSRYKDIYIVIDTKESEYDHGNSLIDVYKEIINKTIAYDESLLDRFIPQIYDFNSYNEINKLYNFKNSMFSIYKFAINNNTNLIKFITYYCLFYDIDSIVIPYEYIEYGIINKDTIEFIKSKNINAFINTINDKNIYNDLKNMGITGVYTDYLNDF